MAQSVTSCPTVVSEPRLALGSAAAPPGPDAALGKLGDEIVAIAGRIAAATCRWLLLVADFDRRDGCVHFGLPTTAAWLSYSCGLSRRAATDHVRVANALAGNPRLVAEMSAGRLSYSHVRAISRIVGDGDAALTDGLINIAEHGTVRQLESTISGLRTVARNDQPEPVPAERACTWYDDAGRWHQSAELAADRGALVDGALRKIKAAEDLSHADALVRLAELALVALTDAAKPARALRGDELAAIVVHVEADRVRRPDSRPDAGQSRPRAGARPYGQLAEAPVYPPARACRTASSSAWRVPAGCAPLCTAAAPGGSGRFSMSDGHTGWSPIDSSGPCCCATTAAARFPAATTRAGSRRTTYDIGCTAAGPISPTWCCCVRGTTTPIMTAISASRSHPMEAAGCRGSSTRTAEISPVRSMTEPQTTEPSSPSMPR